MNVTEYHAHGENVDSTFSMEPGAAYGDNSDAYYIEAMCPAFSPGSLSFSSFEQMEEISRQLSEYVEHCRKSR